MNCTRSMTACAALAVLLEAGSGATALAQQPAGGPAAAPSASGNAAATPRHKARRRAKSVRAAGPSSAEMAQQLDALREEVHTLQRRLDTQTAAEQQTQASADRANATAAAASTQAATATAATQAIPAEVKTAVAEAAPKTDKIYYKGVRITLGGFVEAASVYRQRDTNNDISTAYNVIPLPNGSLAHVNQFLETARQSRFQLLAEGNPNASTRLSFYSEFDLQGAAATANSRETNSYNPRLRELFGAADWDDIGVHFLAGQAWSMVTMNKQGLVPNTEALTPTIDGQYMPGFTWARQPQLRLTKDFDKQLWLGVSLENPQTSFYNSHATAPQVYQTAGTNLGYNSLVNNSLNRLPDVVGKIAYDTNTPVLPAHVEAYGLYSNFTERLNGSNETRSGGGFGGGIFVQAIPKILDIQVSGLAGKGIGRYGSGQLSEVTFDTAGGLQPVHEVIALAGLTLHATPAIDLYLYAGQDRESEQAYNLVSAAGVVTPYGLGNPLYSNLGCYNEGAAPCAANERYVEQATTGFWHKPYSGPYGMVRWGAQYSHTQFKAFTGAFGAPTVIQNMVFLSFRYYPFVDK